MSGWSHGAPINQVRFARPTDRLEEVVRFYRDGPGLDVIGAFEDHAGYDALGQRPVARHNPYWRDRGVTFEDPDGWRVVLMHSPGV